MQIKTIKYHSPITLACFNKSDSYKCCECGENDTKEVQIGRDIFGEQFASISQIEDIYYHNVLLIVRAASFLTSDISFHTEGVPLM